MNLCIVTSSYPQSASDPAAAAGVFVRSFAAAVRNLGHDVTVLTQDRGLGCDDPHVVTYPWLGRDARAGYLRPYWPADIPKMVSLVRQGWRALASLHEQRKFDHVMAMWAAPAGHLARKLKKKKGTPYTVWCLGSDIWVYGRFPILRRSIGRVICEADVALADGHKLAADAKALGRREVHFLPSSRRLDRTLGRDPNLTSPRPRFLFVGRYAKVKGPDVLLEAMARYLAAGGKGTLYMFGGGPLESWLRARVAKPDLGDFVHVGGYASEADVVSYMRVCDALVISSRMESIPVILSDAWQMGLPVIATDVGDMGALLRTTGAGVTVPAENPHDLARAMQHVSRSRYAVAVKSAAALFDIDAVAAQWIAMIM